MSFTASAEPYSHPNLDFNFVPPAGWVNYKEEANRVIFNSKDDLATLQVSAHQSTLSPEGFDDPAYLKTLSEKITTGMKMRVLSTEKITLGNVPALRINMEGQGPKGPARGFFILGSTPPSGGVRYAFLGMVTTTALNSYKSVLEASAKSFKSK